jgi:AraC family transcriptional regulator
MICTPFYNGTTIEGNYNSNQNRITYSSVANNFVLENFKVSTYSIKYVLSGTEHYLINKRSYPVGEGQFLIVNGDQPLDVMVKSKKEVTGLCIHLEPTFLSDVYTVLTQTDRWLLENKSGDNKLPEFEQMIYSSSDNVLGAYLSQLAMNLNTDSRTIHQDEVEVYTKLSDNLLQLVKNLLSKGKPTGAIYYSTEKELARRLDIGKQWIESNNAVAIDVNAIAKEAMLSPSHFFRSFKKAYGVTPYQYYLNVKLQRAAQDLQKKELSITAVATKYDFPDLPSFSKAFKRVHGFSPKEFLK